MRYVVCLSVSSAKTVKTDGAEEPYIIWGARWRHLL